ncbi:FadR/GntR family transcriptional regulator [Nitratidesulfovibrio termitidis]|uniref:FadR/GntR family transcriptional regulator n=1 Tax=Nitratidesulfovibrio termitidis TaxID=42252 RepID=UPI0004219DD9|nr:GntR family transcriptional regulator [Nitratidesulfovibrio termitidis]
MHNDTTEPLFTPAEVGRAGQDVALQIEAAIIEGRILPGQCLPSERDLHMQFRTSRGVIREALRALTQKGLLEIRKGSRGGAYVKQIDVAQVSESLALFLKQHPFAPASLIEFRESIDRSITTLAIARATPREREALVAQADRLAAELRANRPDLDAVGEIDRQLNLMLAHMARNPIFEWVMAALQAGFSSHDYRLYESPEYREATAANWCDTARAIAANEPMQALACISRHYLLLGRCVHENAVPPAPDHARPGIGQPVS